MAVAMTSIADFLRARIAERRAVAEAAAEDGGLKWSPGDETFSSSVNEADSGAPVVVGPWDYLDWDVRRHIAAHDPAAVIADLDAKLALIDEIEPPEQPAAVDESALWCCNGQAFYCPLCPEPRIRQCLGHPGDAASRELVRVDNLHARRAHPDYEYATTSGPRKQWDDADVPPRDDNGEPQPGWEPNTQAGCEDGWERFDHTEEAYWRRLRPDGPRTPYIPRSLRILAQPFAGHPDHRGEEWAP